MRNAQLHDALRAFALEASALLCDDLKAGAELGFDLDEGSGHGPRLYHYRPLTASFIAERWPRLRCLETCAPAGAALGTGAAAFLRLNGLRGAEAEPALRAMLERLWEDVTDFAFPEERFERVYCDVERTLYERSRPATIVVPVHGLELRGERAELGDGMALERGELADAPEEAVLGPADPAGEGEPEQPAVILSLTRDIAPGDPLPVEEARARFRSLLTGLRLWKAGGVALGGVAWRRSGDGVWQAFEIEATGAARGEPWILVDGEEAELLGFLAALEASTHGGSVAWALARFEMGCGRRLEAEALSDYLLALRALADPGDGAGRSSLALRVAVLCAEERDRRAVQRRLELAQALERFVMGDSAGGDYLEAIGSDSPRTLVDEVERHLRALLRDVVCGYLDADLRAVADELLLEAASPRRPAAEPEREPVPEPEPSTPRRVTLDQDREASRVTSEIAALEESDEEIGVVAYETDLDDASSWSAPV